MRVAQQWLERRGKLEPAFVTAAFAEQKALMLDTAKDIAGCCSRRAGKSMGLAGRLVLAAQRFPGELAVYISQTKNNSRMIVGRALMNMSRIYGLGLELKEVDQRLHCIHPNGSHIWLAGAKHREAFEDFRGHKFSEIQIDEAQFHGSYLQEVIEEVLDPARADFDAALVMSGTPSPIPIGFFHAVTTGMDTDGFGRSIPQWSTHQWTMAENTFFRHGKGDQYREEIRKKRNWSPDHPTFRREYWGEWVHDSASLVYPYSVERNTFGGTDIAEEPLIKVLGVDLGYEDSTAFILVGHVPGQPKIYVLKSWTRGHLIPSAIAAHIERWKREHRPAHIVVDAGGLGKGYVEEFNQRYGLGVEYAEKQHKLAYMEMLRGDFMSGTLLIDPFNCRELLDELLILQWNEDRDGVDERFQDHACDALLYAWRACRAHYRPELEGPKEGTPEWINQQVSKVKAERERDIKRRSRKGFAKRG